MPARSGASSSSMHTSTSLGSSWFDGSPSRQSPSRLVHRPRRETLERDSPSRQVQHAEFNLMLNRSERSFYERLDLNAAEQAKDHEEQLSKAALEHERVQRCAKLEIDRLLLQQEQEKQAREEQQRLDIERLSREKARQEAEAQQRRLEMKQREEQAARQAAERQRQQQEVDARLKAQKEQLDAARRQQSEREEVARKTQEAVAAAEKARNQQLQQPPLQQPQAPKQLSAIVPQSSALAVPPTTQHIPGAAGLEEIHAQYLALHQRMKGFWGPFSKEQKNGGPLKVATGEIRRQIRLRLGQISTTREASKAAIMAIRKDCFDMALSHTEFTIDIRPFIISHPIPPLQDKAQAQVPKLLLYAFIIFTKLLIKQIDSEVRSGKGTTIQEIGLVAASLLADPKYTWMGIPMTDIVMAKYHHTCPILFGIKGNMNTPEGKARLGWKADHTTNTYNESMIGLGCGFAALSLRQFSGKNPAIPITQYWLAVASICNTPAENLYAGHYMVLKGLLQHFARKFLGFYGAQARGVLRKATVDLPARAPQGIKDVASILAVLKDDWAKNENINLD
ncbi:hypothetical protein K504DRAFT_459122 [Pleomassaria siparia CBS 279.74]|uniref:mRNA export factor GLE1 n=1 Tax=Pleomassaria siparia CBS 279.74 TaxID=1314801 RepID=A0A6G1K1I5_9PLEO|nr:hypothetical protein K504DRAFT_459122 [Pleomassaria siparia CBS 279.74]